MIYIVYTHTDFLDICYIQTDYLINDNKILLINSNDLTLDELYSKYDSVIFYNNEEKYSSRLQHLNSLLGKYEYVLFIHDIDIVLHKDNNYLNKIISLMKHNTIDKVDLQWDCNPPYMANWYENCIDINTGIVINTKDEVTNEDSVYLSRRLHGDFLYNVNPCIWNLSRFLELLNQYPNIGYREIESNIQILEKMRIEYTIYQLYSLHKQVRKLGYFNCLHFFQFLHITHGGRLIPKDKEGQHNSLYDFAFSEYQKIINTYLVNTNRSFRRGMSEHEY